MSSKPSLTFSLLAAAVAYSSCTQRSYSAELLNVYPSVTSAEFPSITIVTRPASTLIPAVLAAPAPRYSQTPPPRQRRPDSTPSQTITDRITKPEVAARGLYAAWKAGDRNAALKSASVAAVNHLFKQRWTGPDLQFMGCNNRDAGFDCFYYYEGGGLNMRVEGGASAGYRVKSIYFIAD